MYLAVCDDQRDELNTLVELFELWQQERHTYFRFKLFQNAIDLLEAAHNEPFTLYLLDVMMPGINGMEVARELRSFNMAADIVFLSSSPNFAYESYGVGALDYLLKPACAEGLFPLLDRISLRENQPQDSLTVKCGSTLLRIPFFQISHLEVYEKRLSFNLSDGSVREAHGNLKDFESQLLSRPEFIRTHRSYIVNMLQIAELSPLGIRTFSGKTLPVSRRLYPQVQKDYLHLLFSDREEMIP